MINEILNLVINMVWYMYLGVEDVEMQDWKDKFILLEYGNK